MTPKEKWALRQEQLYQFMFHLVTGADYGELENALNSAEFAKRIVMQPASRLASAVKRVESLRDTLLEGVREYAGRDLLLHQLRHCLAKDVSELLNVLSHWVVASIKAERHLTYEELLALPA